MPLVHLISMGFLESHHLRVEFAGKLDPQYVDKIRGTCEAWLSKVEVGVRAAALAVIEELSTNVMEHSGGSWLEVSIADFNDGLLLSITDDGQPFDAAERVQNKDSWDALENAGDRSLGLVMLKELTRKLRYTREFEGTNRLVMEVPLKIKGS